MLKSPSSWSKGAVVAVALLGLAPCAAGAPQTPDRIPRAASEASQGDAIARAVAELAHPDAGVRERASRYLWLAGKSATAALSEAAMSGDPEVATRAQSILLDFRFGIFPDTPREMRDIIVSYRDGQANDKVAALAALWRIGKPAYPVIVRLWLAEADERASTALYQQIAQHGDAMASALIAEEAYDEAEALLERGVREEADGSIRGLAAYRLLRGELEDLAQAPREAAGGMDGSQLLLLVHLYRAKGDLRSARQLFSGVDAPLREQLLVEIADWAALAELKGRTTANGASIEQLGLLATYQRLAGDAKGAEATLETLKMGEGPVPQTSAVALLVNGKAAEAVEMLRRGGHALAALELLAHQQRYREALVLAEQAQPKSPAEALRLSASKGAVLHYLGERRPADEIFDALAQQSAQTGSVSPLAAGLEAALRWDIEDQTIAFTANLLERGRTNPDPASILGPVFHRRGEEAAYWWSFFREFNAGEKPEASLRRVSAIIQKRLPREEVLALAQRARKSAGALPRHWRYRRLEVIGQTLLSYGADAEAEDVLGELAGETGRVETYLQLGHAAMRQQKWEAASEYYGQAMQRDRSLAAPRYLRGWALLQSGQAKTGNALIQQAELMPLADAAERFRLAEALREVGLAEAERRQYELILSTGPARSEAVDRAIWRLFDGSRDRGNDPARASRLASRAVVRFFDNLDEFEISTYLRITHLAQSLRAQALLADGKIEEAVAVAHASFAMLPASSNLVIEMTPQLEKLGHARKADELVARTVAFHDQLIADHPRCASHHNSVAWTLARCRRQLDKAMQHAKRAAELEPENCAILDTLAEVHFQRGEKEEAIRVIRKCIDLEPGVERHRMALERFEKLGAATEPPNE